MTHKEIALHYLNKGLSVIPLWSKEELKKRRPKKFAEELNKSLFETEIDESEKEEITKEIVTRWCKRAIVPWTPYQEKLPTEEEITSWFDQYPDANIGIITGKISGLVVFDLDSQGAVDYAEGQGGFPDTVKVKTGKGYHVYLKYPGFEIRIKNQVNKNLHIDIRADGGYVAAPPSVHGSGSQYAWEPGYSIDEMSIAQCPDWAEIYLKEIQSTPPEAKKETPRIEQGAETQIKQKDKEKKEEFAEMLQQGAAKGSRNHMATKVIGHLLKKLKPEEALEVARMWNHRNNPPLDETELKRTFDSISKLNTKQEEPAVNVGSLLYSAPAIKKEYKEDYVRVPFGRDNLSFMEKQLSGGLMGGRLYILGGIPSAGKTALINCLADNICLNGTPVLFFSFDDGKTDLLYRSYARFSKRDIEDFNKTVLSESEIEKIGKLDEVEKIRTLKYVTQEIMKIEKWQSLIDQIVAQHHRGPVLFADYLRKLNTDGKSGDERQRVDEILSNLTELAKKNNIPILVISELARDSYKSGQRLSMASFKESGSIEYEASWLGILALVDKDKKVIKDWEDIIQQTGDIDLMVFKAKRGTGERGTIPLTLDKNTMTVSDLVKGKAPKRGSNSKFAGLAVI